MDIVKKNLLSIIFGVIAIAAVVANFYPMGGKRDALRAEVTQHAQKAEELKGLMNKPRKLPTVMPGSTEDSPLPGFPTKDALEKARSAVDQVNKAAETLMDKASGDLNIHKPLVAGSLPGQPGDTLPASYFARMYVSMFPPPLQNAGGNGVPAPAPATRPAGSPPSLMDILNAGTPPTDYDLQTARAQKQDEVQKEITRYTAQGQVTNQQEVQDAVTAAVKEVGDQMRSDRAKKCKVWVAPDAFSSYPGMTVQAVPSPTDIFWAQIGLWVQQDVCHAIADMNASSPNVIEAPVKMLVKIQFDNDNQPNSQSQPGPVATFVIPNLPVSSGVGNNNNMDMPGLPAPGGDAGAAPPVMDPNAPLDKKTLYSPTGRVSNGLYDVVHFEVEMIVDASKVSQALAGLEAGRYICVTQVQNIETVDSALYRGGGYYFGQKPCVKIKARCEELFFRKWLADLVPTRMKTILGYPQATPGAPAAPASPPV